ncbi:MAG: Ribosome recycling factor, partial [uncultured Solirubrobacteraceae bacterium]
ERTHRRADRRRARPHDEVRRGDGHELRHDPDRPGEPAPAGPRHGRLLRGADAAQAARDGAGARGAPAHRHAVRQELDQRDREVDPRGGPGAQPLQRRQRHPPHGARAHRGAPQGPRQDRAHDRGGGPGRHPQRPARGHARPARPQERGRRRRRRGEARRGRAAEADRRAHRRARRDPQGQRGRDPRSV